MVPNYGQRLNFWPCRPVKVVPWWSMSDCFKSWNDTTMVRNGFKFSCLTKRITFDNTSGVATVTHPTVKQATVWEPTSMFCLHEPLTWIFGASVKSMILGHDEWNLMANLHISPYVPIGRVQKTARSLLPWLAWPILRIGPGCAPWDLCCCEAWWIWTD